MQLHRIVVGVDGSPTSQRALDWACALATLFGAEIVAVHGANGTRIPEGTVPATPSASASPSPSETPITALDRALESWTWQLRTGARPHRTVLLPGHPYQALLDVAAKENAELIVVGNRGAGGPGSGDLGSTAYQLTQLADRPVLVVRDTMEVTAFQSGRRAADA